MQKIRNQPVAFIVSPIMLWALLVTVFVFTGLRDLPAFAWLWPCARFLKRLCCVVWSSAFRRPQTPNRLKAELPTGNFSLLSARVVVFNRWPMSLTHPLTTTTFELPGYRVIKSFGVVRGIIVRSRSIVGNFGASIQAIFGGNISLYTNLCEHTREDAFNRMLTHAGELGANAVVGVRYDATELAAGITEVLCYRTPDYVEAKAVET